MTTSPPEVRYRRGPEDEPPWPAKPTDHLVALAPSCLPIPLVLTVRQLKWLGWNFDRFRSDPSIPGGCKSVFSTILYGMLREGFVWPAVVKTNADLAAETGYTSTYVAQCLRILEDRGLIERRYSPFESAEREIVPNPRLWSDGGES